MNIPKCIDLDDLFNFLPDDATDIEDLMKDNDAQSCLYQEMTLDELFQWAIFYGFTGFCAYLYVEKELFYIPKLQFMLGSMTLQTKDVADTTLAAETSGGNTSVTVEVLDKRALKQNRINVMVGK